MSAMSDTQYHHGTANFKLLSCANNTLPPVYMASERHLYESDGGREGGATPAGMATDQLVAA